MIDALFSNPYYVLGTILMVCLSGYITWRNNFKIRRATACKVFRAAVLTALDGLYPIPSNWPDGMGIDISLRTIFPSLQTAVENFRPYVPWWKKRSFNQAWSRYRLPNGREIDQQCYHHYIDFSGQPDPKRTFHAHVDRLLSFANEY